MSVEERLTVAEEALRHIKEEDPGPARYIAKNALEEIKRIRLMDEQGTRTARESADQLK